MLTYLLPTHNRHAPLQRTLEAIAALSVDAHESIGGAEVIVVDNASDPPAKLPSSLRNGLLLRMLRRETNQGTAARNFGVEQARGEWIVMLDDDSHPLDANHVELLSEIEDDVAAIGADIFLPDGSREAGGLPEVFIGCGVAIRRNAFLEAGGYDAAFDYYAEEYDLCAKLMLHGWRIVHDQRFRVLHEKISAGRDMNRIIHRLVRNNCWVAQRYAPADMRDQELSETVSRYARIAMKEGAACGFALGMTELLQTLDHQPRAAMSPELFDRFTGLAHVRATLAECSAIAPGVRVAIVDEGKNVWAIRQALQDVGARVVERQSEADCIVIGTLSPGPMLDAFARWTNRSASIPVICPWRPRSASVNLVETADGRG